MSDSQSVVRFVLLCLFVTVTTSGCGYGEITPQAYEYSKALYSACNRQDGTRFDQIVTSVDVDLAGGQLTKQEADWLLAIVRDARQGDWEAAGKVSRRMMEDQVR